METVRMFLGPDFRQEISWAYVGPLSDFARDIICTSCILLQKAVFGSVYVLE